MATQLRRPFVAAPVALIALLVAHWFDAGVVWDAQTRAGLTYDFGPVLDLISLAHLLTAAGVVAIAASAWWSRSALVGIGFALVGGFIVALPAIAWTFAGRENSAPPVAPEPIATQLNNWWMTLSTGVTGSVYTLAGSMFLSGLVVLALIVRRPRPAPTAPPAAAAR